MQMIPENVNKSLMISIRGAIGVIGFILSPLSWWNDIFVNFPLSFAFAWGAGKFLTIFMVVHQWLFLDLFLIGYFLTNLIGFLMIHYSVSGFKKGQRGALRKQIMVCLFYALIVVAFFKLDICNPEQGCKVLPPWVRP